MKNHSHNLNIVTFRDPAPSKDSSGTVRGVRCTADSQIFISADHAMPSRDLARFGFSA